MNRRTRVRRKSSHEGKVGRHKGFCYTKPKAFVARTGSVGAIGVGGDKGSYYTEFEASMVGTRLVGATGASRGVILSREDVATTGGIRSFGNGGMCGFPYISQR